MTDKIRELLLSGNREDIQIGLEILKGTDITEELTSIIYYTTPGNLVDTYFETDYIGEKENRQIPIPREVIIKYNPIPTRYKLISWK